MSDTLPDLVSCLPSQFLTHDHMDNKTLFHHTPPFPHDFASSSSTESESDDDDISGLTRRFTRSLSLQDRLKIPYPIQKKRVFSGSPESTLSWAVSGPPQVRSSPTTPFVQAEEDAWDLIYAAAAQVARMKMRTNSVNGDVFANRGLLGAPRFHAPPVSHHHPNCAIWRNEREELIRQQQFRYRAAEAPNCGYGGRCGGGRAMGFRQSAWPPFPVETQGRPQPSNGFVVKPVLGGSGRGNAVLKRECAGTGVFLPRRYCNDPPESKKIPACSSGHLAGRVGQSFIVPQPNMHQHGSSQTHVAVGNDICNKRKEEAEMVMWRRKGVGQGRSSTEAAEVVLPQEWTY